MKRILKLIAAALLLSTLIACAADSNKTDKSDNGANTISDEVSGNTDIQKAYDYMNADLSKMIKLGDYTGLSVTKVSSVLTDEEFDNELNVLLNSYSYYEQITDRQAEEGDTVLCDYSGVLDGVKFEGGTAENREVKVAADSGYIPGFAEAFIGQTPGTEFSFDITFPEDYKNAELAGAEVTFVCTIHAIYGSEKITPELTDEFVNETFGYNNAEEFKIAYRASVSKQKEYYVENTMYSDLWAMIVDNAEVLAYPEEEVNRVYNERRAFYEQYAVNYGTDYETFITNYVGMTDEDLLEECRKYVKEDLVMYQLIEENNIELSDEEYEDGVAFYADYYGSTEEELLAYYGEDTIKATVLWQKLMDTLAPKNNIIEE